MERAGAQQSRGQVCREVELRYQHVLRGPGTRPGLPHCVYISVWLASRLTPWVGCICFHVVPEEMEAQVMNMPKVTEGARQSWESDLVCLLKAVLAAVPPAREPAQKSFWIGTCLKNK